MTPLDLRNETWESLQARVIGARRTVLNAWRNLGRGTTRDLSARAAISILQVRPRTTELVQLGLVRLVDQIGHEGVYEALPDAEGWKKFEADRAEAIARHEYQPEMKLL